MNRREALRRTSMALGFAVSVPLANAFLSGCTPRRSLGWRAVFLTKDEAVLVGEIAETILPKTETPGALELRVDQFIDHMLNTCYEDWEQEKFKIGLKELDDEAGDFISLSREERESFLTEVEEREQSGFNHYDDAEDDEKPFFLMVKELTLLGYFSSEKIMKNQLQYVPIPTRLEGCNDLETGQKLIVGNHV